MTSTASKLSALALFLVAAFVLVPWLIALNGRSDLYYTLTSVALLSIASAGVWLTFFIGRINIGQGAYALLGGYVSAILITAGDVSFWLSLPLAGLLCAGVSILTNAGLPEFVARNEDEYLRIAAGLAERPTRVSREQLRASPVMDAPAFARDFVEVIFRAWREQRR